MAVLEVKNLKKRFESTEVLKGIDFTLDRGEVLSIIGSSGSGKTTLLRCLNFLETPTEGQILVDGKLLFDTADPATQLEADIRKKRLHFGLVFQSFNLFPQYTAKQNVMLAMELLAKERPDYKRSRAAIQKRSATRRSVCSMKSVSPIAWDIIRTSFPAGSSSGSPLRVRSH